MSRGINKEAGVETRQSHEEAVRKRVRSIAIYTGAVRPNSIRKLAVRPFSIRKENRVRDP